MGGSNAPVKRAASGPAAGKEIKVINNNGAKVDLTLWVFGYFYAK